MDLAKLPPQNNPKSWPELEVLFTNVISTKTRDEWMSIFEQLDACVTPVLEIPELMSHPQHVARQSLVNGDPAPCPRLDKTPAELKPFSLLKSGQHTQEILKELAKL